MKQENLFVNDYKHDDEARTYTKFGDAKSEKMYGNDELGVIIPFDQKIKMEEKNFNVFLDEAKDALPERIIANHNSYRLSDMDAMLLLLEFYHGNDLHEFVEIKEPKHIYRIKKGFESRTAVWDKVTPYLYLEDGVAWWSSDPYKYTRSEFEKLPKEIQNLFEEVEEEK